MRGDITISDSAVERVTALTPKSEGKGGTLRGCPLTEEGSMPSVRAKKSLIAVVTLAVLVLAAGLYAIAQQPYQLAPMDEPKRVRAVAASGGTYHVLPATLQTTQWGWLDPAEPPKLTIKSGDTVAIETMMHSHNAIQPGATIDDIV